MCHSYLKINRREKENTMSKKIFHGFIDEGGILLDDDYNELRDEEGCAIHIPEKEWEYYKTRN